MVHMEENGSSTKIFKSSKGQRNGNPQATLNVLSQKREKLAEELRSVEKQVYDIETTYLHDSSLCGSVLKGFDAFLSSSKNAGNLKRSRKFQPEDRLFSLSSVTSPAVQLLEKIWISSHLSTALLSSRQRETSSRLFFSQKGPSVQKLLESVGSGSDALECSDIYKLEKSTRWRRMLLGVKMMEDLKAFLAETNQGKAFLQMARKQPKRGRTVPREGKRVKQGNDQDPEEDEDLDLVPR